MTIFPNFPGLFIMESRKIIEMAINLFIYFILLLKSYTKYNKKIKIYKGNRTIHSTWLSVTQYRCS